MQYNLDFLNIGNSFPPKEEAWRMKEYQDMRNLLLGHTEQVVNGYWARFNNGDKTQNVKFIELNYFKLIASKTADLVCGEKPDVILPDDLSKEEEKKIANIIGSVNTRLRKAVFDYISLGDTTLRPYRTEEGKAQVSIISPHLWMPVVNPEDTSEYQYQVVGYADRMNGRDVLKIQIHDKGSYIERVHRTSAKEESFNYKGCSCKYKSYDIGKLIDENVVQTGLDTFAIKHIANEATSSCVYGVSDFKAICSLVADLEVRFAQRDIILDKHASPSIAAPESNFEYSHDQSGEITGIQQGLLLGNAWVMQENGQIPQYVTWDGQLQAVERDIQDKMQQLFILTEMGAVLDDTDNGGTQGYEALQVRMVNARLKARRIVEQLDTVYKEIINDMYKLETGKDLKYDFSVVWNDGLPDDAKRNAEVAKMINESGFKSKISIRKEFFNMTEKQAEEEQKIIDEETPEAFEANIFE